MRAFFGFVLRDFRERKFRACLEREREREGLKEKRMKRIRRWGRSKVTWV
jgi:hypothetical protein